MTAPDKPPPPRPKLPSRPERILDEKPEPSVLVQQRFDRPGARRATMPEMQAVKLPGAPELPLELGQTQRAPSTTVQTVRATPQTGTEAVRAKDAPPASLAPASADSKDAQIAALRARAEAAEQGKAELERQARVAAESKAPGPYQAPIERRPSPPPTNAAGPQGAQGRTGEQGAPASKLAQLPAILLGAAAFVTAIATAVRPAPDTKAAESYTAIRDELVKQNKALQQNGDSDEARWNVIIGLFKATGVKVTEAPGTPKVEPLALEPAPLSHRVSPSSAPAIQVRDPLPPPVPSVAPVKLPKDLASLPKTSP